MAKIITIASQKGGTGKTTTALCLGAQLEAKGYKVLYIDLDTQANLTYGLNWNEEGETIYSVFDIYNKSKTQIKDLIQTNEYNQSFIPGSTKLNNILSLLNEVAGREQILKNALRPVLKEYDFIVIDTPPAYSIALLNALTASNYLVVTAYADIFSLNAFDDIQGTIKGIKAYTNKKLKLTGVLLTQYKQNARVHKAVNEELEAMAKEYKTKVFKTRIRECSAIPRSQIVIKPITLCAPKSNANIDYLNFTNELLEDIGKE